MAPLLSNDSVVDLRRASATLKSLSLVLRFALLKALTTSWLKMTCSSRTGQEEDDGGGCPAHMFAALSEVLREEGVAGLYRGWSASCLKVMPTSGITWMFYEAWKDILLVNKQPPNFNCYPSPFPSLKLTQ